MNEATSTVKTGGEQHAILEIMGHDRLAGRISELMLAGVSLIAVDVPDLPAEEPNSEEKDGYSPGFYHYPGCAARPGYRRAFGGAAIFSVRYCSAEEALADEVRRRTDRPRPKYVPPVRAMIESSDPLESDPFGDSNVYDPLGDVAHPGDDADPDEEEDEE